MVRMVLIGMVAVAYMTAVLGALPALIFIIAKVLGV